MHSSANKKRNRLFFEMRVGKDAVRFIAMLAILVTSSGCSSLGLSLWPSQFPLLTKAKQFAKQSPVPSGLEHELSKAALPEYFVEPGDRILIEPLELDSEIPSFGEQEVKIDGSVDLGRYGRLRVAGMTVEQIELAVADHLESVAEKREIVNVQLVETNAAKVYVLGAVGSPGAYDIEGNETVLDAILLAGGLTSRASPCDMLMVRPTDNCECRVVQRICYRQITQLGDAMTNYQLQPGDRIVVGELSLCDELAVWRQTRACPCCDRSQCVQKNPASERYTNRFLRLLNPFPLPEKPADENDADQPAETVEGVVDEAAQLRDLEDQPQIEGQEDSDFFLPPVDLPPTDLPPANSNDQQ